MTKPMTKSGKAEPVNMTSTPAKITPVLAMTSLAEKIQLAFMWAPESFFLAISNKQVTLATKATKPITIINVDTGSLP